MGGIPEQATLDAIEQILLDSAKFQRLDIDQVQLMMKRIILKPGKKIKGDKRVSAIHVVVPKDKKAQTRKALKIICPSIPIHNYSEGIQWITIENIADRNFTMTEQSFIVVERIQFIYDGI